MLKGNDCSETYLVHSSHRALGVNLASVKARAAPMNFDSGAVFVIRNDFAKVTIAERYKNHDTFL
jgi:glutamine amidotransferase-like uncharacterized protein